MSLQDGIHLFAAQYRVIAPERLDCDDSTFKRNCLARFVARIGEIVSTESARESDSAVAERNQLAGVVYRISAPAKEVLGTTSLGATLSRPQFGPITDEMIREYIDESEQVADDSRFQIDNA